MKVEIVRERFLNLHLVIVNEYLIRFSELREGGSVSSDKGESVSKRSDDNNYDNG